MVVLLYATVLAILYPILSLFHCWYRCKNHSCPAPAVAAHKCSFPSFAGISVISGTHFCSGFCRNLRFLRPQHGSSASYLPAADTSMAALSGLLTAGSEKSCCILQKFIHFTQTTIFFFQRLDPLFQLLILFSNAQRFFWAAFAASDVQLCCFYFLYPAVQRVDRDLQFLCCCFC